MGPCGLCDRCAGEARADQASVLNDMTCTNAVLQTVAWCDGRFGVSRVVEILRGSQSKAILSQGAGRCESYGACRDFSKSAVTQMVKDLIDSGHLAVIGQEYPLLDLTRLGREVLNGTRALDAAPAEKAGAVSRAPKSVTDRPPSHAIELSEPGDPQLYERLRRLRTALAEEEGVAPFVIFHDKTLRTIASHKPVTRAALLEIPGIGDAKADRYGRRVLEIVNGE